MRHDNFIPPDRQLSRRSRGRLPHWELDDAVYSVTFRLHDSLPLSVAQALVRERWHLMQTAMTAAERAEADRLFAINLDSYLDAGYGSCILREAANADIIAGSLRYFDGQRYTLHAWCVMPNHVHVMFQLSLGRDLAKVMHSWKSFTSHEIDRA